MRLVQKDEIDSVIENSPEGNNKNFLKASHNLWIRFHNYEKQLPMVIEEDGKIVCVHFATFNKNGYTNSYEIVTLDGQEGKGFAKKAWNEYLGYAVAVKGMTRLKNSCIASSVSWHVKNGLIFWGIDPTGSLKTDQPIFPSILNQIEARKSFIKNPLLALPKNSVVQDLRKCHIDNYNFGEKKRIKVKEAIATAGKYWLGGYLTD